MPYLIDGHNVVHALPDIDLEDPHDEVKLVYKLRAWAGRERRQVIVVFDGGIPGGTSRELSTPDVHVVFAARQHSIADRIIKERLRSLPDAPNWTIVSSDREVLDSAREVNACVITAQVFADRLSLPPDAFKEKPDTISQAELEAWLKIFEEAVAVEEETWTYTGTKAVPEPGSTQKTQTRQTKSRTRERQFEHRRIIGSRPLGEQVGMEPTTPAPKRSATASCEKPEGLSDAELAEWLAIFPESAASDGPPPFHSPASRGPESQQSDRQPPTLTVKKEDETGLSAAEVEAWLNVFGGEPEKSTTPAEKSVQSKRHRRPKQSVRLRKHKQHVALPPDDADSSDLSDEDQELWYRMFGKE
ncbi:MAG: NYN domain-containing protein [Anaerolineae bacterium]|nr:NYN domain-containing protein [Anaerolineae bacterium]